MSNREIDHTNVFESYLTQSVFALDILEKLANDWKRANRKMQEFNRDNFEDFVYNEFMEWICCEMEEFADAEWG